MSKNNTLKLSQTLALTLNIILVTTAQATKLNAPPLPREREIHDFSKSQEVVIPSTGSLLRRRPGFREEELEKKQAQAEAEQKAEQERVQALDNARKTQQQQVDVAIDANNKAVALGKQGRWAEAIQNHEIAVQYSPGNRQFRINLSAARTTFGQQRLARGDAASAAHLFRKALAAAQDNGLAGRLLIEAIRKTGVDATSADVRLSIGDQLSAANDLEGAYIEYQSAMQLENSARTLVKMGDMAYRYGQIPAATNWYRQAIVKEPDYGAAHRQLGFLAMTQQDYTTAAACLRKAIVLNSKDTAAGQALIDIWRRQVATNALSAENHLGLAGALQLSLDFIGAESEYNKVETLDRSHPGLAAGRASLARAYQHIRAEKSKLAAITLFNQGLRKEALDEIKEAVKLEPRNANYQFLLGECLESVGDYASAHQVYFTCVLVDPENNKEAAARMKKMQLNGNDNKGPAGELVPNCNERRTVGAGPCPAQAMHGIAPTSGTLKHESDITLPKAPQARAQAAIQPTTSILIPPQTQENQEKQVAPITVPKIMANANNMDAAIKVPNANLTLFGKNIFEESRSAPHLVNQAEMTVRSSDDEKENTSQNSVNAVSHSNIANIAKEAVDTTQPTTLASTTKPVDDLTKLAAAEKERDYTSAISILCRLSNTDMQNPEIHHRLAVNLLASGQITEALSEFRIASALSPQKKEYLDDLSAALSIHKKSLMSDASSQTARENGVVGANK